MAIITNITVLRGVTPCSFWITKIS